MIIRHSGKLYPLSCEEVGHLLTVALADTPSPMDPLLKRMDMDHIYALQAIGRRILCQS